MTTQTLNLEEFVELLRVRHGTGQIPSGGSKRMTCRTDREAVLAALDDLRRRAREHGREEVEDVVMDVMDYVGRVV